MIKKTIKTILFASLMSLMILPVGGMNFDDIPEAFAMQHDMESDRHFHSEVLTETITKESTMILRDSKATSFNPIHFEHSYSDNIPDRTNRSHN